MGPDENRKTSTQEILRLAGGFLAYMIGPGFATGEEILQFFSSFGIMSFAALAVNLVGFVFFGRVLMVEGYRHRAGSFDHFPFYCGSVLGRFYNCLILAALGTILSVLMSAGGETIGSLTGCGHWAGAVIMAVLVVSAYLSGFQKLVRIISPVVPLMVTFALTVGVFSIFSGWDEWANLSAHRHELWMMRSSPHWGLSALLYLSLGFLGASSYYTELGKSAASEREARLGAALGAVAFVAVMVVMNAAILLNLASIHLDIPMLFLARQVSSSLGVVFSLMLALGTFSSSAAMMWTVCSRLFAADARRNRLAAVAVGAAALILGMLPFGRLINVFYPLVGYAGLAFCACAAVRGIRDRI